MQFVSGILTFQCLLVLTAIFVSVSNALICTTCLDDASCTNKTETQECTAVLVTLHHNLLLVNNPSLNVSQSDVFKCYDLAMSYQSPLTGSTVLVVQKGCTYNATKFCEGWVNTTTITRCTTCDSGDDCNKGQTEGTTTPVAPTTPLNNSTTTTEASSTTYAPANSTTTSASVTTTTEVVTTTTAASNTTSAPANSTTTSASVTTTTAAATTTTAASSTTSTPAKTTTTSASTTVSTASPITTTTAKAGGTTNLGCVVNWFTIAGYAVLHGLIARW
ncbi:uncharacterized protein LOC135711361 [Ochlerotatus camptorhynchus]|uniref:uncharacterized protein LOC135711361 n=1 Tax=Ochlerotatus camptorhynchus TaxID=644619 RepID=UPI0031D24125